MAERWSKAHSDLTGPDVTMGQPPRKPKHLVRGSKSKGAEKGAKKKHWHGPWSKLSPRQQVGFIERVG